MSVLLPIVFAAIAAIGNALFALGQKQSAGAANGMVFVALSALVAAVLAGPASGLAGPVEPLSLLKANWRLVLVCGVGLFLTYLGFNLLYTRFGASHYVLYATLSIVTTSVGVGVLWLRESLNGYHTAGIVLAVLAVVLFSFGQARA